MPSLLNPYINFRGQARDAAEFYQSVFGGELELTTYAEGGMPHAPENAGMVMHAQLRAPNGMNIMLSDTPEEMPYTVGNNVSISLSGDDKAELTGYWNKLLAGGTAGMPLMEAPWGDTFGMLVDKFGIGWMVNIAGKR
jgi:PhnB protein